MSNRTWLGGPLTPGVNVDKLNIAAGLRMAATVGYGSDRDQMVVTYALQRWTRGEEDGADRTWQSEFPRDMTSWRMILASAMICPDCDGRQGMVAYLPGDGTACMEEVWMPCQTCDPDYYKHGG